jgi:hypothetical protein
MERVLRGTFGLEEPLVRELGGRRGSSERSASDEQPALVVRKASFREVAATEARACSATSQAMRGSCCGAAASENPPAAGQSPPHASWLGGLQ